MLIIDFAPNKNTLINSNGRNLVIMNIFAFLRPVQRLILGVNKLLISRGY